MAEIMVTSTADSGAGSLRQAIADAADGDVILFDADVFPVGETTSILLSSYISVSKSVSIYGGFNDGAGGYTSGATKRFYVYREVEGVKTKTYIDDETPAQDGETVLFENVCRVALDGQETAQALKLQATTGNGINIAGVNIVNGKATDGGAISLSDWVVNNIFDCTFDSCTATTSGGGIASVSGTNVISFCSFINCSSQAGGGLRFQSASDNNIADCCFVSCVSSANGGAIYSNNTGDNILNTCIFYSCTATNGGGVYSTSTSENTLNGCTFDDCTATNGGGGIFAIETSQLTLNDCAVRDCTAIDGAGFYSYFSTVINVNNSVFTNNLCAVLYNSTANITGSSFSALTVGATSGTTLATVNIDGITTVATLNLRIHGVVAINDGAALTITTSASIASGAAFTSSGRGYLAVAAGINTSSAILTNVVLCAYGAGIVDLSATANKDVATIRTTQTDATVPFLLETLNNDAWETVSATATNGLQAPIVGDKATFRTFDGASFLTTTVKPDYGKWNYSQWTPIGWTLKNWNYKRL